MNRDRTKDRAVFLLIFGGMLMVSSAIYYLPNWMRAPTGHLFSFDGILGHVIIAGLGAIFVLIGALLPFIIHRKVEPEDFDTWELKDTQKKGASILIGISLVANGFLLFNWFQRGTADPGIPALAFDIIILVTLVLNAGTLWLVSMGKYLRSDDLKADLVGEGFYWLVILQFILVYAGFGVLYMFKGGIFEPDPEGLKFALWLYEQLQGTLHGSMILVGLITLGRIRGSWTYRPVIPDSKGIKLIMGGRKLWKTFLFLFFSLLFVGGIGVGLFLGVGDYLMFFSFFSVNLAIGLIIPTYVVLEKLKSEILLKLPEWKIYYLRVFTVFILIMCFMPLAHTSIFTHYQLDREFATHFGEDWDENWTEAQLALMRPARYNFYENLHSFDIPVNARYNISYLTAYPRFISGNDSVVTHEFMFDAYLPQTHTFGEDNDALPVIVMFHGEVEDRGPWNANMTSQYLANLGFLVIDPSYGYITHNHHGPNLNGYLVRDVLDHLGALMNHLSDNSAYFHADLGSTYFSGRHLGGTYALICGLGYNYSLSHLFPEDLYVKGILPYYPIVDFGEQDTTFNDIFTQKEDHPILLGDEFTTLNPIRMLDQEYTAVDQVPPILIFEGTHDVLIPLKTIRDFRRTGLESGHTVLVGEHLLGGDGYDGMHSSPWGQSILYYYERFLFLTL